MRWRCALIFDSFQLPSQSEGIGFPHDTREHPVKSEAELKGSEDNPTVVTYVEYELKYYKGKLLFILVQGN